MDGGEPAADAAASAHALAPGAPKLTIGLDTNCAPDLDRALDEGEGWVGREHARAGKKQLCCGRCGSSRKTACCLCARYLVEQRERSTLTSWRCP